MAADVSSRQIKSEEKTGLTTRDFLGGGCSSGIESNQELDLDLHVPSGWEKHLDLKSGRVYIQRCNPANANSSSEQANFAEQLSSKLQDLNSMPRTSSSVLEPTLNLLEQPSLDLKLVSNCSPSSYTSVCTLDKVKSALDRAERSSPSSSSSSRKRWMMPLVVGSQSKNSPSPSNSSSLSIKETEDEEDQKKSSRWSASTSDENELLVAAACPGCFLYVLISKNDPKCPKCSSVVQLPVMTKKPRIDLNISI